MLGYGRAMAETDETRRIVCPLNEDRKKVSKGEMRFRLSAGC